MKIAVLGAGFTGLTAALKLQQAGQTVTVFESDSEVGGLAGGFRRPGWDWALEKSYHHWFTSDSFAQKLARQLHHPVLTVKPETNIYFQNRILPIDTPLALLSFPYLSTLSKIRSLAALAYLKLSPSPAPFEGKTALPWIKRWMGKECARKIWDPLFTGKFGDLKGQVSLPWFWGRIKKRSKMLCYPEGGIAGFAQNLAEEVEKLGGLILLKTEVTDINKVIKHFDKVIITLPTPVFVTIAPGLPPAYVKKISSIPHLSAQNLILILKKPFLKSTYWLNINEPGFPFLLLAEHTNFIPPKHYGGQHILYIGNYLPSGHPYLKMNARQLLKVFYPFLKKINPNYELRTMNYELFNQPFAQPVVTPGYLQIMPQMKTPLKNVYLANMDMIYPWDRETNYAIELGEKVAQEVLGKV